MITVVNDSEKCVTTLSASRLAKLQLAPNSEMASLPIETNHLLEAPVAVPRVSLETLQRVMLTNGFSI